MASFARSQQSESIIPVVPAIHPFSVWYRTQARFNSRAALSSA
jgi:hypothetical protein